MGTAFKGPRSYLDSPYHFCSRCRTRDHLSNMTWQRGLLLCSRQDCVDHGQNPLLGMREADIDKTLEVPTHELEPDPKLISTLSGSSSDDDFYF